MEGRDPFAATLAIDARAVEGSTVDYIDRLDLVAGRYKLLALLGSGGMGAVYKARDTTLDEVVALKVLRRDLLAHPSALERFRREVKLARRVTHKNIARVHDLGEHNGEPFLTMELVEGESLRTRLQREGPATYGEVLDIAKALAEGLDAAHRAGVIHRDLKPDNILLGRDDRVVITDFGIARAADAASSGPTQGGILGTPQYMAPEQVDGSSPPDARTDVYALGVMLFELYTGALPFTGDSVAAIAFARLLSPPPDPQQYGVPEALARVITKCLERRPDDRYARAADVLRALEEAAADPGARAEATMNERRVERAQKLAVGAAATDRGIVGAASPKPSTPSPSARAVASSRTPRSVRSVAVLPLRNGGPKDDDYLADSFTEDIVDQMSRDGALRVRPLEAVRALKHSTKEARDVGADLGVDIVVAGSVRKVGDTLRVALRAVSVADGFQVWAERFDRPASDALKTGDEIAAALVDALAHPEQLREARLDTETRDLYERALAEYHRFEDVAARAELSALRATATSAAELFEKARAKAPTSLAVLVGCALAFARSWFFDADGARARADDAATRAWIVSPDAAESLAARAVVALLDGNLAAAAEDAAGALAADEQLAHAHHLVGRILCEADGARGLDHLDRAATLDPRYASVRLDRSYVDELVGRSADADRTIAEVIANRESGVGWASLARVLLWRRDHARARELLDHPVITGGKAPSAREILRMVVEPGTAPSPMKLLTTSMGSVASSARTRSFLAKVRAEIAGAQGRIEDACAALAESVESGLVDRVWLDGCPTLREVRADRRYAPLRAQVEARASVIVAAIDRAKVG